MALADILRAMEAEAEAESARQRAQTDATVAQIRSEAEAAAGAIRDRHHREVLIPLQQERARRLNRARLAALRATSRARERLFAQALACARERLATLRNDSSYTGILHTLVQETLSQLDGAVVVRADPRDESILRELLPGVQPQFDLTTWGGIEARGLDGQIAVTNTLEARLEQAQEQLRQQVMPLFERPYSMTAVRVEAHHES